ncbi:VOC family protein [Clostridium saccharoperbutylacetonicum]|jgi:predicted enzyme related to lactoylglutathione lyase|uniref:Putative lactoylglutathione lyase n=1 Tax=Clostridium saccharoperbutylacetonicum N1-4(HMT) TaxID=931276 RepID=M1MVP8_9CLOT|nr:VOC family protein [Clostridium saccharoperbutylacetonicum]AGF55587.1 putative lactoylglutathione lyase [Clostridium saccharoperbutylacetonicum N1-4(HMT)]AQR94430.1 glyoxalase-like domain protein [Clostridium saccharoperbutylacetonicum]NRT63692.1 putative enzyme related to lactoylglutathione lyase [Clostridium saccharoperbutylacetonicum]NSB27055.1 putative enzyme related to lactoylglutathione lyase [Clostridium saccharoperbutylacetonicum]NSB30133.1 putative enzyme related to lactoylglutathi
MSVCKNENLMIIFYVKDQGKSKVFYKKLLGYEPTLDVVGMTEFHIVNNVLLGLMPEEGIMRILENKIPNPKDANGVPRSELYIFVDDPDEYYLRAITAGGTGISKTELRNWGDYVAYCSDVDGHILAFAKKAN